jgi:hypothetical protein
MVQTSILSLTTFILFSLTTLQISTVEARIGVHVKSDPIDRLVQTTKCFKKFTLAGHFVGPLLGGSNPCQKLEVADKVIELGATDPTCTAEDKDKLLNAAMDFVAAEKNFGEFGLNADSVCLKAGLPKSPELQGILQFVDPRNEPQRRNFGGPEQVAAEALNAKVQQILDAAKANKRGPGSNGASMAQLLVVSGDGYILFLLLECVDEVL